MISGGWIFKIKLKSRRATCFVMVNEEKEQALYLMSCAREGAEILNLSNPGDYSLEDYVEPDYEIVEV